MQLNRLSLPQTVIATLCDVTIHNYNVSNFYSKFGYSQSEATKHKKNAIANLLSENPEGIIAVFYNSQLTSPEHATMLLDAVETAIYPEDSQLITERYLAGIFMNT